MITPRPSLRDCIGNPHIRRAIRQRFMERCGYMLGLLLAVLACAGVLLLALAAPVQSAEVPAWVLRGIAAVETGTTWRDMGDLHYRDRRIGADGEVGPWQLAPSVLKDLGVEHLRARIHREPILAESMTRAWLLRCHRRTGDWFEAVAIFHTGPHGERRRGHSYAARVRAVGTTTN